MTIPFRINGKIVEIEPNDFKLLQINNSDKQEILKAEGKIVLLWRVDFPSSIIGQSYMMKIFIDDRSTPTPLEISMNQKQSTVVSLFNVYEIPLNKKCFVNISSTASNGVKCSLLYFVLDPKDI